VVSEHPEAVSEGGVKLLALIVGVLFYRVGDGYGHARGY
jgi:hypothetical protein